MACAGSSGGFQPPHQHPYHLPLQCELDDHDDDLQEMEGEWTPPPPPPKKKQGERGPAKGLVVQALKQKLGGAIPIVWDPRPQVRKVVGEYSEKLESELGKIVRNHVPVYTENWRKVSQKDKELIWKEVKSTFYPMEEIHKRAVMTECSALFRHWKGRCTKSVENHAKSKKPGPAPKRRDVNDPEHWNKFLQHISSPNFIEMSNRNKKNRANLKYVATQGRRSMPGYRWIRLTKKNQKQLEKGVHPFEVWADQHKRNGVFVNPAAEEDYMRLLEVSERLAPDGKLTFKLETQIFEEAFGARRDSVKGLGPTLSSQSSQSFESPSSSTPDSEKIARLERKLKKSQAKEKKTQATVKKTQATLHRFIINVKALVPDLPDVIEGEDEGEDEDEDEYMNVDLD